MRQHTSTMLSRPGSRCLRSLNATGSPLRLSCLREIRDVRSAGLTPPLLAPPHPGSPSLSRSSSSCQSRSHKSGSASRHCHQFRIHQNIQTQSAAHIARKRIRLICPTTTSRCTLRPPRKPAVFMGVCPNARSTSTALYSWATAPDHCRTAAPGVVLRAHIPIARWLMIASVVCLMNERTHSERSLPNPLGLESSLSSRNIFGSEANHVRRNFLYHSL